MEPPSNSNFCGSARRGAAQLIKRALKDKSGVSIIVHYSRDYTVVNGVWYFFKFVPF